MKRLGLFLLTILASCSGDDGCSSEILTKTLDPRGERYATTEIRSCGATTGYATVVRIGRSGEDHSKAKEVFVADSNRGAALMVDGRSIWISLGWTDVDKLSVTYASNASVFKQLPKLETVTITYRNGAPYQPVPPSTLSTGAAL